MTANLSSLQNGQSVQGGTSPGNISPELVGVLQKIVQNVGALLEVDSCSVAMFDSSGTTLVTLAALQKDGQNPRHSRFHLDEGVAGWVAEHREPLIINDVAVDPRFKRLGHTPIGSMMCVPLINDDHFLGTLTASNPETEAFSSRQLQMLAIFAEQAILAITNARQAELAQRQANQLEMLLDLSRGITTRLDADALYRTILALSADGIALVSVNRRFIEVNPAFGRIFGLEPEQIVGMECVELFACQKVGCSHECCLELCMVRKALQEDQPLPYVEIDLSIKGMSRSVGLSITPVSTTAEPLCLIVARDVTAIRDANRLKANFLSMITHELRSPLNAIHGFLDLTLTGIAGELNGQQREFIQRARASSEHLYALVEDLLLVSRADSGQFRLSRNLANLSEIVINTVEELELMAKDGKVTVNVDIPADFPPIYVDAGRMQQVLRNLVSNALRFTPPDGQVSVTASIMESEASGGEGEALGSEEEEESHKLLQIQVRDTGCGIAPEHFERIFERFYRAPQTHSGRTGGQGLGLSIVKMIVELHGGQVSVESIPEQGSTFICLLPCLLS